MVSYLLYFGRRIGWLLFSLFIICLYTTFSPSNLYWAILFSIIVLLYCKAFRKISPSKWLIIIFSISYVYIIKREGIDRGDANIFSYLVSPLAFFVFGSYVMRRLSKLNYIVPLWTIIIFVTSIQLFFFALFGIAQKGVVSDTRQLELGESFIAVTLYGLVLSLSLVGFPLFFLCKKTIFKSERIFLLSMAIISLVIVFFLQNRSPLVVGLITFLALAMYMRGKNLLKLGWVIVLAIISIWLLIDFGVISSEVIEAYKGREVDAESNLYTAGSRTIRWADAVSRLATSPFGWENRPTPFRYVHNLWLDIARTAGLIPFLSFVLLTIIQIRKLVFLLKTNDRICVPILLALNVAFFFASFNEPVITGLPMFFYLYIFLWGMQSELCLGVNKSNKR